MPETSVQRRDEALPDKSGVSMSSISLSLEAETCPEDVRFVRYSRQLCNIVGSVKSLPVQSDEPCQGQPCSVLASPSHAVNLLAVLTRRTGS